MHQLAQWALFALLLGLDQLSKWWIGQQDPSLHITVIENFFNIVVAHNPGVAFSLFADWDHAWRAGMLIALASLVSGVVLFLWWKARMRNSLESWALPVILAGACGNIWDRIQFGYVIDFIQWYVVIDGRAYYWPTFNIADACISVAVVLLVWDSFFGRRGGDAPMRV